MECRLAGKTPEECRQQFGNSTAMPPPDKVKERFELETWQPSGTLFPFFWGGSGVPVLRKHS